MKRDNLELIQDLINLLEINCLNFNYKMCKEISILFYKCLEIE